MPRLLQRVVVLGAGTMGARLAAHCANHGLQTTLLDQTAALAAQGLEAAARGRPAAFFLPHFVARVRTGDWSQETTALRSADWVVEAVVEDLHAKRQLLAQIAPRLSPDAVLTSNTSGLPLRSVGAELPPGLRRRWLGTHFFNPPRYMTLTEVIPTADTDPEAMAWLREQIEVRLGKGVVEARDTPNFIANRIGLFALMHTLRLMEEMGLSVEEVDALTGPLLGWPKSATFRTLDMIGLDTLAQVVRNSYEHLAGDEQREMFRVPGFVEDMLARGWKGEKSGQGFYQKQGEAILALDLATMSYRPRKAVRLEYGSLTEAARQHPFVRRSLEDLFAYCQTRLGEITDDPAAMDRAMRWGYNWQYGPFELRELLEKGAVARPPAGKAVRSNPGCTLLDLGDGIGCLEFHSKLNIIGADTVAMVQEALVDMASPFTAFVVSNEAEHFSAGADLAYLLALIQNEEWEEVAEAVEQFQAMNMALQRSPRPVVVAPFGMTLGGGCEMTMHAAQVVAHAELYAGLVEAGVGLIPAGGGTKEMALRRDRRQALETIAMAKVSNSAAEARQLGFLRPGDLAIASRQRLRAAAKQAAQLLAATGYEPPAAATVTAPGPSVESTLQLGVLLLREADKISEHEQKMAYHVIHVLCCGGAPAGVAVPVERLLELEREAFLSLCGEAKTQERMAHMLRTGKALRN
jgi:3-hydroxyacyl-CoA dehydrogenase